MLCKTDSRLTQVVVFPTPPFDYITQSLCSRTFHHSFQKQTALKDGYVKNHLSFKDKWSSIFKFSITIGQTCFQISARQR